MMVKLSNKLIRYFPFVILNFIAVVFYFFIISFTKYGFSHESFFYAPDAQQYLNTAGEFYDFNSTGNSYTRPFLYPLLLAVFYKTGGVYFLWFFQFSCWLASVNLLFCSIRTSIKNQVLPWVAVSVFILNISFIAHTMQALTEVFCVFLLTLMLQIMMKRGIKKIKNSLFVLMVFALLTVTRPVFFYPFLLYFLYHFFLFIREKDNYLKNAVFIFLAVSPVLYQMTLMKVKYDVFKVSQIDSVTLDDYLIAQTIQASDTTLDRQASIKRAREIKEKKDFLIENSDVIIPLFFKNILESLNGYPSIFFTKEYEHYSYGNKMWALNKAYLKLHILFFIPLSVFLLMIRRNGDFRIMILLFIVCCYIVITSGISFSQGDRLVLTIFPIWIFLYTHTFEFWRSCIMKKKLSNEN